MRATPSRRQSRPPATATRRWRAAEPRLVSSDAPFWFFKVKEPAARIALEGLGFNLDRLQLTLSDIERVGPALIVDHTRDDGRLLVW